MVYPYSESDNEKKSLGHFVVQELTAKPRIHQRLLEPCWKDTEVNTKGIPTSWNGTNWASKKTNGCNELKQIYINPWNDDDTQRIKNEVIQTDYEYKLKGKNNKASRK